MQRMHQNVLNKTCQATDQLQEQSRKHLLCLERSSKCLQVSMQITGSTFKPKKKIQPEKEAYFCSQADIS